MDEQLYGGDFGWMPGTLFYAEVCTWPVLVCKRWLLLALWMWLVPAFRKRLVLDLRMWLALAFRKWLVL